MIQPVTPKIKDHFLELAVIVLPASYKAGIYYFYYLNVLYIYYGLFWVSTIHTDFAITGWQSGSEIAGTFCYSDGNTGNIEKKTPNIMFSKSINELILRRNQ